MGEGELARVLAAVEALTSQVGDISTAVQQQQQQGLEAELYDDIPGA